MDLVYSRVYSGIKLPRPDSVALAGETVHSADRSDGIKRP